MRENIYSEGWYLTPIPGFRKYLSIGYLIGFNTTSPTVNSPDRAKPAWGVIMSLVISSFKGSIVYHIISSYLVD
jgi:hypothetical protein